MIFLLVSGLGYGIISGLFAMVNVLADITGPGTLGLHSDPQNFLIVSGKLVRIVDLFSSYKLSQSKSHSYVYFVV